MNQCESWCCSIIIQNQCGNLICLRCTVTASVAKVLSEWQQGGIKIKITGWNNAVKQIKLVPCVNRKLNFFSPPPASDDCSVCRLLLFAALRSAQSGACRSQLRYCVTPAEMISRISQLQKAWLHTSSVNSCSHQDFSKTPTDSEFRATAETSGYFSCVTHPLHFSSSPQQLQLSPPPPGRLHDENI